MCVLGAAAHRLVPRSRRLISAAHSRREYLLDKSGTRAARARCFCVLAHVVKREQSLALDRFYDRSLADAVAAAHLHFIRHGGRLVLPLMSAVAEVRLTEHQVVANIADALPVAQQLKVPGPVDRIAIEHAADYPVI